MYMYYTAVPTTATEYCKGRTMVVPYDQRGLWFCGEYRSEPWDSINPYIIKLTCCRDIVSKKKYIDLKLDILRLLQLGVVDVRTAAVLRYNVTAENSVRYLEEASCGKL